MHRLDDPVDVVVLAGALSLASWLAVKRHSRKGLFALMVGSLLYFGFYKKGCVCPIGSIQNVALSLFQSNYAVPATVLIFFLLPLALTLTVDAAHRRTVQAALGAGVAVSGMLLSYYTGALLVWAGLSAAMIAPLRLVRMLTGLKLPEAL